MKLLNFLKPKPKPTIESYGQPAGSPEVQSVMEWLFASLLNAGYVGKSHLIWYDSSNPDPIEQVIKKLIRQDEPVFLYRIGGRTMPLPQGYYWRMMSEHRFLKVRQC